MTDGAASDGILCRHMIQTQSLFESHFLMYEILSVHELTGLQCEICAKLKHVIIIMGRPIVRIYLNIFSSSYVDSFQWLLLGRIIHNQMYHFFNDYHHWSISILILAWISDTHFLHIRVHDFQSNYNDRLNHWVSSYYPLKWPPGWYVILFVMDSRGSSVICHCFDSGIWCCARSHGNSSCDVLLSECDMDGDI